MLLFVLIVATLYFGKEVLIPVVLALLLAFFIAPLVDLLRRIRLGQVPSVLLAVVLALGLVLAIGGVIGTQVAELSTNIPKYVGTVETKIASIREYTVGRLSHLADTIGVRHAAPAPATPGASVSAPPGQPKGSSAGLPQGAPGAAPQAVAQAAASSSSGPLALVERRWPRLASFLSSPCSRSCNARICATASSAWSARVTFTAPPWPLTTAGAV
jgi:hypothetical protein